MTALAPLPVALPLIAAALLAAGRHWWPRRLADALAIGTALANVAITARLLLLARSHPIVYWMGGWHPRGNIAIGISLAIDPMGAGMALFAAVLVAAALIFSLQYFDSVGRLWTHRRLHCLADARGSHSGRRADAYTALTWLGLVRQHAC